MLVGVNLIGLAPGTGGAEEVYLRNVLQPMGRLQRSTRFVLFTDESNHEAWPNYERIPLESEGDLGRAVKNHGIDVVFSGLNRGPIKVAKPIVILAMELWPVPREPKRGIFRPSPLKAAREYFGRAKAVVAPSRYVQKELLETLGVPLDRTVVAPLGVKDVFGEPRAAIIDEPYLLIVGRTRSNKNLAALFEAFERLKPEIPHHLVMVGKPGDDERAEWGPRVMRFDFLPAAQLAALYQHCAAFICSSVYEGSGVTVLEAMKAGSLIVTGRIGGITEVAGNVPIFFNPESVDSMVGAIRRAVSEPEEERKRRAHFGKKLAAEYTWEKCASLTLSAIRKAEMR